MDNNMPLNQNLLINKDDNPKIYSKRAILGFSIFFSSIFGGVLLVKNLRSIGKKKEANIVLLLSIIYTVVIIYIVNIPDEPKTSLTYLCNMAGALVLTELFYKKHFLVDGDYEKKKIWKPLIISILITIPFILALVYA